MYQNYPYQAAPEGHGAVGIYPIPFMPLCVYLANAYVPYQYFGQLFGPEEALEKGTLFPDLYSPYVVEDKEGKICPKE